MYEKLPPLRLMRSSCLSPEVLRRVVAVVCGVLFVLSGQEARAESAETVRSAFARALAIEPALVSEATEYEVKLRPAVFRGLLGLYGEGSSRWRFPALVVYHACPTGSCMTAVHLGSAAKRLVPVQVVDLDAPRTVLEAPQRKLMTAYFGRDRQEITVPTKVGWPALAIVVEQDTSDHQQTNLLLVSLPGTGPFRKLGEIPLVQRYPEPQGGPPIPSYGRFGFEVERIVLSRDGNSRRITATSRAFLPSTSGCPAPGPEDSSYILEGSRYQKVPGAPLSTGCP